MDDKLIHTVYIPNVCTWYVPRKKQIAQSNAKLLDVLKIKRKNPQELYILADFWSECKERSDGIASLRASKTSRSAERSRRATELALPGQVA